MDARPQHRPGLFYRTTYVYDVLEAGIRHTFDVQKPRRIHDALIATGAVTPPDFTPPASVTNEELLLVHTPAYLEQIRRPEVLAKLLFLDPTHPWDERLLEPFLFATGGTIAAARLAMSHHTLAMNLGGGFHHAQADRADGFCAIADVAIAIRVLQRSGQIERALIVDLDYHHGNGNAEIFAEDESVFTFSIHAGNWCWITKRNNRDVELPSHTADTEYLDAVQQHLPPIVADFQPDIVFYVAGSDPFVDDTLGDFDISEPGMLTRDQLVTREVRDRGIPMVVVTAGGYGTSSWRIHFNYFHWLLTHEAVEH